MTKNMTSKLKICAHGLTPDNVRCYPHDIQVEYCKKWLKLNAIKQTKINRKVTSYGLKHRAEDDSIDGKFHYVVDGSFLQAAKELGYDMITASKIDYNHKWKSSYYHAYLNIALREPRKKVSGFTRIDHTDGCEHTREMNLAHFGPEDRNDT